MDLRQELREVQGRWLGLNIYQKFEHIVISIVIALIAIVIVSAVWSLAAKVLSSLILSRSFDPTDHVVFQNVFGMIFTVIIGLEFKRSLLLVTERKETVVQVRAVILIAMLAIVRKLIIHGLATTTPPHLLAPAAAIRSRRRLLARQGSGGA